MTHFGREQRGGLIREFASRLKFPQLFTLVAVLFLIDLLIPDPIPFLDEILLGLATVLLGMWRENQPPEEPEKPPMKNVTPRE